jgi:myo-inositol-1(or 4)-monophosphatase
MDTTSLKEFKQFSSLLIQESTRIINRYFRTPIDVQRKYDNTPVTIADKKAEEKMRELIIKHFPDHGILGEEFGNEQTDAEYVWVLDPIDGTKSFICGAVTFGTLIGLLYKGESVLGIIHLPALNESLYGDNNRTELNGKKVSVRKCENLSEAVLLTTEHHTVHEKKNGEKFEKLSKQVYLYRNLGDCYGYYLLASGFADIMLDPIVAPWDVIPVIPIVRGSGGVITDWHGQDPVKGNSVIASASDLHPDLLKMLNGDH